MQEKKPYEAGSVVGSQVIVGRDSCINAVFDVDSKQASPVGIYDHPVN